MKMLAVFVLAVLGWSLAEGKHVSKCELRDQLKGAMDNPLMKEKMKVSNVDDVVAKIVCNTEVATGFNTNAMKQINHGKQDSGQQGVHSGQHGPEHRGRRNVMGPSSQNPPSPQSCTLHGVFQLASHQACDDGVTPSSNICGMPCSNLHDENLQDDVSCLLKTSCSLGDHLFGAKTWQDQGGVMKPIMEKRCENVQAHAYFSECRKP